MKLTKLLLTSGLMAVIFSSCETDDVKGPPVIEGAVVNLSVDKSSIPEDGGTAVITASLSESTSSDVSVELVLSGSADGAGVDYNISTQTIDITAGSLSATATISAVQDTLKEGNELINVVIKTVTGASIGTDKDLDIIIEDDDVPFTIQIIINEILYDPSNNALDGDANGDGVYAQAEDEFLEFINLSSQTVDLSGYEIYDTENLALNTPNHTIPTGTLLAPGKALVVFGGGTPTGTFGGAIVQTSTSGDLNMNNAGDIITLKDPAGNVMVTFDIDPFSNNPNESYTRDPDITGSFVQHSTVNSALFSPGTKVDGTPF